MNNNNNIVYLRDILKSFTKKYPILKDVQIELLPYNISSSGDGECYYDLIGDYIVIGKNRYRKIRPFRITIVDNESKHKLAFVLLHEIAHAISDYCERRLVNGEWIRKDHNREFYTKFLEVIKVANELNIIDDKYDLNGLIKKDKLY